jgi:predicted NUDIX family NTP pyrophosphohydrolase
MGHRIELRVRDNRGARAAETDQGEEFEPRIDAAETDQGEELELRIDGESVRYGRLPDGQYALDEYAYDWSDDLMDLARKAIEYRDRAGEMRAKPNPDKDD